MSNDAPTMGLAEAAKACSVSVSTLRRRKEALVAAGATVSDKGWRIPIPALVSLGFLSSTTAGPDTAPAVAVPPHTTSLGATPLQPDTSEVDLLRSQLAEAETRAQVAEAIAAERERIIAAQAMTLRMLEAGRGGTSLSPVKNYSGTSHESPVESPSETVTGTHSASPARPTRGFLSRLLNRGQ